MNDEYLWQKTGEDPDTMRLENALAVFRYREDDPPAVPVAAEQSKGRRWRLALAFAVPAFATVVVAVGVWLLLVSKNDDYEVTFVYHPEPVVIEQSVPDPPPVVQPPAPEKQPVRRGDVRSMTVSVPRRPVVKAHPRRTGTPVLTKEEQYAYNQLMLALSISSSKINIVRNAIDGVEETENDARQNNR